MSPSNCGRRERQTAAFTPCPKYQILPDQQEWKDFMRHTSHLVENWQASCLRDPSSNMKHSCRLLLAHRVPYIVLPSQAGGRERLQSCGYFWFAVNAQRYIVQWQLLGTYDHRSVKTGHPVRSAIHKH
jgi:hypothetical protein